MYETGLLADFRKNWHFHFASKNCSSFKKVLQFQTFLNKIFEAQNEKKEQPCTGGKMIFRFPNKCSGFTGKKY